MDNEYLGNVIDIAVAIQTAILRTTSDTEAQAIWNRQRPVLEAAIRKAADTDDALPRADSALPSGW